MIVKNENHIEVYLGKVPTLTTDSNGSHRGKDFIVLSIPKVKSYDTDLIQDGNLALTFSNEEALRLAQQLIECAMQNVDEDFEKYFPGIP